MLTTKLVLLSKRRKIAIVWLKRTEPSLTSRANALDSFPEEKSPAEKASKKIELEVNPNSIFVFAH